MLGLSANISLLFRELPLLQRFEAARAAGFPAVEIQNPYEHSANCLTLAARAAGVEIALINAPMGDDPRTLGTASLPRRAHAFRAELELAAEYASTMGARVVNVLAGRADPAQTPQAVQRLIKNLDIASTVLAQAGARAVLEVINPISAPGYCVPSFELAAAILDAGDSRAGLQFDIYHAGMLGLDPIQEFKRWLPRIAHVQFADTPGRHEPGTGVLDFPRIFNIIRGSEYSGWLGAEYHPAAATAAGLQWMKENF